LPLSFSTELFFFKKKKKVVRERRHVLPLEVMGGEGVGGMFSVLCKKRQINAFLSKVRVATAPFSTGQGGQQVC